MLGPGLIEAGGSAELPVGSVQVSTFPRLNIDPTEPEACSGEWLRADVSRLSSVRVRRSREDPDLGLG